MNNPLKLYYLKKLKDVATSALAGFHVSLLSWSNWNLEMLVFAERGKLENPENRVCALSRNKK